MVPVSSKLCRQGSSTQNGGVAHPGEDWVWREEEPGEAEGGTGRARATLGHRDCAIWAALCSPARSGGGHTAAETSPTVWEGVPVWPAV